MSIRSLDGISNDDINLALSMDRNHDRVFKSGEGEGRSGSFFFFSHDNNFLIKTVNSKEKKVLSRILNPLIDHFRDT